MMKLSNSLSIRRLFLRRPKVCKTPKSKLPFISIAGLFVAYGVPQKKPPVGHPLHGEVLPLNPGGSLQSFHVKQSEPLPVSDP